MTHGIIPSRSTGQVIDEVSFDKSSIPVKLTFASDNQTLTGHLTKIELVHNKVGTAFIRLDGARSDNELTVAVDSWGSADLKDSLNSAQDGPGRFKLLGDLRREGINIFENSSIVYIEKDDGAATTADQEEVSKGLEVALEHMSLQAKDALRPYQHASNVITDWVQEKVAEEPPVRGEGGYFMSARFEHLNFNEPDKLTTNDFDRFMSLADISGSDLPMGTYTQRLTTAITGFTNTLRTDIESLPSNHPEAQRAHALIQDLNNARNDLATWERQFQEPEPLARRF